MCSGNLICDLLGEVLVEFEGGVGGVIIFIGMGVINLVFNVLL